MAAQNEDINKTGEETKIYSEDGDEVLIFSYLGSFYLKWPH